MVKKYFVLTILAITFVSLLVFLSSKYVVKKTITWEHYQNNTFGYEFSYPKDEPLINHKNFNDTSGSFEFRNLETINPNTNPGQFSISGQVVSTITISKELLQSATDPNSVKLLNNPNLIYGFVGDPPYSTYITYFPLPDNKYYEVAVRFSFIEEEKVLPLAKKILSTVKINPVASTWKTYKNEKYGFEFQYPSDWVESDEIIVSDSVQNCSFKIDSTNYLKATLPLKTWVEKQVKANQNCTNCPGAYMSIVDSNYKIGDIKPVIFTSGNEGGENTTYLFEKNKNIFSLTTYEYNRYYDSGSDDDSKQCSTNLSKILDSLKFLPETLLWKTYKNDKYGFEFHYQGEVATKRFSFMDPRENKIYSGEIVNNINGKTEETVAFIYNNSNIGSEINRLVATKDSEKIINGNKFLTLSWTAPETGEKIQRYYIEKDGNLLSFNDTKALSSLKFTYNTSTWKTYRNAEFGFEFKLPPQYKATENKGFRDAVSAIEVVDTREKVEDVTGKLINKPIFYIRLSSQFIYNPEANTPKIDENIGGNIYTTFRSMKYEMYDLYYFEKNSLLFVSERENLRLTNPYFDQILSSLKFSKIK